MNDTLDVLFIHAINKLKAINDKCKDATLEEMVATREEFWDASDEVMNILEKIDQRDRRKLVDYQEGG